MTVPGCQRTLGQCRGILRIRLAVAASRRWCPRVALAFSTALLRIRRNTARQTRKLRNCGGLLRTALRRRMPIPSPEIQVALQGPDQNFSPFDGAARGTVDTGAKLKRERSTGIFTVLGTHGHGAVELDC